MTSMDFSEGQRLFAAGGHMTRVSLVLIGLVVAGATALMPIWMSDDRIWPVAVGTLTLGLVFGALLRLTVRGSDLGLPALTEVLNASPFPSYLVRMDGAIETHNAAASRDAPLGQHLNDVLGSKDTSPEGQIYRLGREAAAKGYARCQIALSGRNWTLTAEPFGRSRQVWRLLPVSTGEPIAPPAPVGPATMSVGRVVPPLPDGRLRYSPDTLLEDLPVALARLDPAGSVLFANRAARRLLGENGIEGRPFGTLLEGLGKPMPNRVADTMAGKSQGRSEVARSLKPGAEGFLQVTMTRMEGPDGPTLLSVLSDATELKTLEAQFVQSQKMQAVGQLAGGIAHDFNNLLTAINGHCDLLLLRHLQGDADHSDLIQIRQNANRAAALVRQLLAFSRKQTLQPQVLNLYDTLAELANLLNRLLGEKVALKIENAEDIWSVRVDERQLEQVIVNLVVNARDAMPTGGVVGLKTEKVTLEAPLERDRAIVPTGDYAVIKVYDSGIGIPKDQIAKIFEPFFTTKKVGEGTGLGLSTAYGIIKQMDGFIFVDSIPGEGSEFSVFLPANDVEAHGSASESAAVPRSKPRAQTGSGVILLAEDEAPVRAFAVRALQMRGYTVLEADCGERALEILEDQSLKVDLFVTDVVMPGIDGPSWVVKALETRPNTSTVFISGYSQDTFVDGKISVPSSTYLAKPFTLNDLIERVREHMERYVEDSGPDVRS